MKKKIIFDTDGGADDLLALFFLLKNKQLNLIKVITSYGNYPLEMVNNRIRKFLYENNFKINILEGSSKPLKKNYLFHGFHIHGNLWTDSCQKPLKLNLIKKIFNFKANSIFKKRDKGKYTYISVGPLTNLSKIITKYPDRINEVFIMGGSLFYPGNATLTSEANFYWDPTAVSRVFNSSVKKYLIPLNLTDKIQFSRKQLKKLKSESLKKVMEPYCDFYIDQKKEVKLDFNKEKLIYEGAAVHDLVTVVISLYPGIAEFEDQILSLDSIESNRGMVIPVLRKEHLNNKVVKIKVATSIDINKFWDIVNDIFK